MKQAEDFRQDYGMADEAFCRCIRETLLDLERKEARPVRKIRWSAAIALALAMLACTAAVAAVVSGWGMMDMVNVEGLNIEPEETHGVVLTEVEQVSGENDYASLTIREAVYDGVCAYIVMDLVPKEENVLMVPEWLDPDRDAISLMDCSNGSNVTIAEWAAEKGFERILQFNGLGGYAFHVNENGSVTLMEVRRHEIIAPAEELLQTTYRGRAAVSLNWYQEPEKPNKNIDVPFVLPNSGGTVKRYVSENATDFHGLMDAQVKLEIIKTGFTNYAVIRSVGKDFEYITVKDGEYLHTDYTFVLIDSNNHAIPDGAVHYSVNADEEILSTVKLDEVPQKLQVRLVKSTFGEEQRYDGVYLTKLHSKGEVIETFSMGDAIEYQFNSTMIARDYALKEYFVRREATLAEPVAFEGAGVVLERMRLSTYAWQTTYEISLSVQPHKSTKKGMVYKQVRFEIVDDEGNVISNSQGMGSVNMYKGTLPFSSLPDSLRVRIKVYDKNGMTEYGPVSVQLTKE